jgi:hypothetical protein
VTTAEELKLSLAQCVAVHFSGTALVRRTVNVTSDIMFYRDGRDIFHWVQRGVRKCHCAADKRDSVTVNVPNHS